MKSEFEMDFSIENEHVVGFKLILFATNVFPYHHQLLTLVN